MGTIVQKQIGAAGFDTKDLKISGTSVRQVELFVCYDFVESYRLQEICLIV